ncbi:MAG: hypothetical protein WCJ54_09210, partial [Actinomycetota bacterium]
METEKYIGRKDLPKKFEDLSLIVQFNFHILSAKNDGAEIVTITHEENRIGFCPSRPSSDRFSWIGCRSISKKLSNEEFDKFIADLKSAGWRIEPDKE